MGQPSTTEQLDLPDAEVAHIPSFFAPEVADRLFAELHDTTPWDQGTVTVYGRTGPIPRLQSWHGDPGTTYTYSRLTMEPAPWTPPLQQIKDAVEPVAGERFNSVLVNLYRDGRDSVSWHADDEPQLGGDPVIASVSLGATRRFQLRHRSTDDRAEILLAHGSLVVMRGPTQRHWHHQVPKTSRAVGPRINLTFRRTGAG